MPRTPLAVLVAASVALTAFAAPANAAEPERRATFATASPKNAVVTTGKSTTLTVSASIDAAEPFYEGKIWAELTALSGNGYEPLDLFDPDGDGVYTGKVQLTALFAVPGKWSITTKAIGDETGNEIPGPTGAFTVRTKTKLAASVSPKKPKKKSPVTLSGALRTIEFGSYTGFGKKNLKILFRKKGSSKWTLLSTVKTKANGRFTKTVTPKAAGALQIVWPGTPTTTPVKSKPFPVK
ncbi:hypothetical protein EDD29_8368 [Actinocorallia herbida]|uniref:Uncharacterized protein n=1 Tax=Actinocorallia herbida TaxID=58109 RepID=A0A3N1DAT4_9ACTN|nr:hypothetical protein [Actinocorallia herbida]ROO90635.1 hypothetical protein EDD29_8368 [Actinocorallia herbida]